MFSDDLQKQAQELLADCRQKKMKFASAESCTGGLICALLTAIPGSSDVIERGFVTYSNEAKIDLLEIDPVLLNTVGAVSSEVAVQMSENTLRKSRADLAVAVTGVAGPGQSERKPVGLVYLACSSRHGKTRVEERNFTGSRSEIRLKTLQRAVQMARMMVSSLPG